MRRGRFVAGIQLDTPVDHPNPVAGNEVKSQGIDPVLRLEDTGGQALLVIPRQNGNRRLRDNRAMVEFRTHEMDRAAGDLHALFDGAAMAVEPWERGQESRMDVEDAIVPAVHEIGCQDPHEPSQAYQGTPGPFRDGIEFGFKRTTKLKEGVVDNAGFDVCPPCPLQSPGSGSVGDDDTDLAGKILPGTGIDQGLEIGAASEMNTATLLMPASPRDDR